jgi:hypothetical protein
MAPREKRLTVFTSLMVVALLSDAALGWMQAYFYRQALLPTPPPGAILPAVPVPPVQSTRLPPLPAPRTGEEGGSAAGSVLYMVRHHGYLMKPPGIQCGNAAVEPLLYLPDRHNDGVDVRYRDAGDRWVFNIAVKYPAEGAKAEAVVTVGCGPGGRGAQSAPLNPLNIKPGRNDKEA